MTRSLLVVQHHPVEGPGELTNWARQRGVTVAIARADRGELPAVDAQPCVLLGGPESVLHAPDWLQSERRWLRERIAAGSAVLGICLGSQLLADALGGRIERMPQSETGWTSIEFADGSSIDALQWHEDTFTLPPTAQALARSRRGTLQMFGAPSRHFGIQFHPEWNAAMVAALNQHFAADSPLPGVPDLARHERATAWFHAFLDGWWADVEGAALDRDPAPPGNRRNR